MYTDTLNSTAHGSSISSGLMLIGMARYTVQGTTVSGIIVLRAL